MKINSNKPASELVQSAFSVQKMSYSPYSNFKVGAAILADNNQMYCGCNVENVSFPLGQCAEGSAISNMIAGGSTKIKEIVIVSPNDKICPPCGGCRQKISEFGDSETLVHLVTKDGTTQTHTLASLLPLAFTEL